MSYTLMQLVRRNAAVYLKDKMAVFFSLLTPLITFALYVLFIGRLQTDAIMENLSSFGLTGLDSYVQGIADGWMISGVMACSCITVALGASAVIIADKTNGINNDIAATPVPKWLHTLSYFISVSAITFIINLMILCVGFIYLAATDTFYMSAAEVFACIGTTALSVLSAMLAVILITCAVKTEGAYSGAIGIISAVLGFLIGAYMPISYYPLAIQRITLFVPGSYSAGMFRNFLMDGSLDALADKLPPAAADGVIASISENFSVTFDLFGVQAEVPEMAAILAASVILFLIIDLAVINLKVKTEKSHKPRFLSK